MNDGADIRRVPAASAEARLPLRSDRAFLGHPAGLGYLAFTEAWERFSFYGMQGLLVLYMTGQLLQPAHARAVFALPWLRGLLESASGPLAIQALASQVFGLYAALVYAAPVLGGLVADRWLGQTRSIVLGALMMAAGHFLMALESAFLIALALLILGVGLLKGNISSQVGGLYAKVDPRRADAFQIFFLAINAGVISAPLICGTLGEKLGWSWGFAAAGVGMLISLGVYLAGRRYLPPGTKRASRVASAAAPALSGRDIRAVLVLLVLLPILALAMVGNAQIFNVYLIWARANANLTLAGQTLPTTWLISCDAAVSVGGLALAAWFWEHLSKRGIAPSDLTKIVIGCVFAAAAPALLAVCATVEARTGVKISPLWLLAFHVINTLGFVNIFPIGLSLFTRAAPAAVNATMTGVYFLTLFAANLIVGKIGSLYETMSPTAFWWLHAAMVGASGLVLLSLLRPLGKALRMGATAAAH